MIERTKESLTYRVVDPKEDVGESVIEKSGMVAEFTLNEIDRDLQYLNKKREELESQIAIESARMENIDRTNPEIGKMSEEMRQVIYIYAKAFSFVKVATEKRIELENQIKAYKDEMVDIVMQTGIVAPHIEEKSPEQQTNGSSEKGTD